MSVLSGKGSCGGGFEPPALGIVQLSPRQASFTQPSHRHQPSATQTKRERVLGHSPFFYVFFNFMDKTYNTYKNKLKQNKTVRSSKTGHNKAYHVQSRHMLQVTSIVFLQKKSKYHQHVITGQIKSRVQIK